MRNLIKISLFFVCFQMFSQIPAFPGAVGYGKNAVGGRGGTVYKVTNLNDSGVGSLRAAVEATGARTVIFEVAGIITLTSSLTIENDSITIAGQSAPGGGITLTTNGTDATTLIVRAEEVIIRYLRVRAALEPGAFNVADCIMIASESKNVIIDHNSFSWATDEVFSIVKSGTGTHPHLITVSNNIIGQSFAGSNKGMLIAEADSLTLYKNYFSENYQRNPRFGLYAGTAQGTIAEIANNEIWGHDFTPFAFYVEAPNTLGYKINALYNHADNHFSNGYRLAGVVPGDLNNGALELYLEGNEDNYVDDDTPDQWNLTYGTFSRNQATLGDRAYEASVAHSTPLISDGVTMIDADSLWTNIRDGVGASLPVRDSYDVSLITSRNNGTSVKVNNDTQTFPTIASGTAPTDTDGDGIPDSVEITNGLDENNASDGSAIHSSGYSNLEYYYLNTADETPAPPADPGKVIKARGGLLRVGGKLMRIKTN